MVVASQSVSWIPKDVAIRTNLGLIMILRETLKKFSMASHSKQLTSIVSANSFPYFSYIYLQGF